MSTEFEFRRVVLRRPVPMRPHEDNPEYMLFYVIETLECGHEVTVYPGADPLIARRRNCPECREGKASEAGRMRRRGTCSCEAALLCLALLLVVCLARLWR